MIQPPKTPRKPATHGPQPATKPVLQHGPNPRLQPDLRWQRTQRFGWDKNRGRG